MALILGGLSLMNVLRISSLLAYGAPRDYLQSGNRLAWFVLANTALQCGAMVSYVWMTASFLRDDLAVQASTDALTGLLNRRAIDAAAERILAFCSPSDTTAVITIDLDCFKKINDTYGHSCGDAVLASVARLLQQGMREGDFLGRVGGDEFVALLPRTTLATARMIADRLRGLMATIAVPYDQARIKVSASFGTAEARGAGHGWDQLLLACDRQLYAAKRSVRTDLTLDDQARSSQVQRPGAREDFANSVPQP